MEEVQQLVDHDSTLTPEARQRVIKKLGNIVLAYNRRVDLTLSSTGQESARAYPFIADDFAILADRTGKKKPSSVELTAQQDGI